MKLQVLSDPVAGPYIRLPYDKLDLVRKALGSRGISHWVEENMISMSGGPYIAVVHLHCRGDERAVQEILESLG